MGRDKDKQREYQKNWIAKRRADYLVGKNCVICGSNQSLHIDHINRATKISHNIWSWSEARRLEELAKCQVLCRICHEKKTAQEFRGPEHGISQRYRDGCRCDLCKESQKLRARVYRAKLKQQKQGPLTQRLEYPPV